MSKKYDYLGERIKKLRVLKKYSQEELGKALNLPKQSVSRIEKGNRTITEEELAKIAEFFGVIPEHILKDGWLENLYKIPYEPQNKWGIEVSQFMDGYIMEQEEYADYLIESGQINFLRGVEEDLKNTIKAFKLLLKEIKGKSK